MANKSLEAIPKSSSTAIHQANSKDKDATLRLVFTFPFSTSAFISNAIEGLAVNESGGSPNTRT